MKQTIHIESVVNARELGGYKNKEGKTIKHNLLLRTGKLNTCSTDDIDTLVNEYHLKKIFDFRGSSERMLEPDPEMKNVQNIWMPILDESNQDENNAAMRELGSDMYKMFMFFIEKGFMQNMYVDMLSSRYAHQQYHNFLKEVIDCKEGAVLWHCSAGKDRTGLAALFLLTILNVDENTILEDYVLTNEYVEDLVDHRMQEFKERGCPEEYMKDVQTIDGVNLDYFKTGLNYIKENYGSVMDYIHNQLNISEEDCEILRNRYLDE